MHNHSLWFNVNCIKRWSWGFGVHWMKQILEFSSDFESKTQWAMQIFQKPTSSAKPPEAQWRSQPLCTIHQETQWKWLRLWVNECGNDINKCWAALGVDVTRTWAKNVVNHCCTASMDVKPLYFKWIGLKPFWMSTASYTVVNAT